MNRIRPSVAIIAAALLLLPTGVLAIDDDAAAIAPLGDADWVSAADGDALVFRLEGGPSLTDSGVSLGTVTPNQMPPPLDQAPTDAIIYQISADADPGTFGYVRIQDRQGLSFIRNGETPVILRAGIGSGPPSFLDDQRIIRLPPACPAGTIVGSDCLDEGLRRMVATELLSGSLDLPSGMVMPEDLLTLDDLMTIGTADEPVIVTGFGGGIDVDVLAGVVAAGDSYEVRATQTIAELFGGEVEKVESRTLEFDADGNLVRAAGPGETAPLEWRAGTEDWFATGPCPPGSTTVVITDTTISGAGANLPATLGPGFDGFAGGTDIIATTVSPLACLPLLDDRGGVIPGVSLDCFGATSVHEELERLFKGEPIAFPTYLDFFGALWVSGDTDDITIDIYMDGVNRDRRVRTDVSLTDDVGQLGLDDGFDSWQAAVGPGPTEGIRRVLFEVKGGIDAPGPKTIDRIVVRSGDMRANVTSQVLDAIGGDSLDVRFPQGDTFGSCAPDYADPNPGAAQPPYLPVILK